MTVEGIVMFTPYKGYETPLVAFNIWIEAAVCWLVCITYCIFSYNVPWNIIYTGFGRHNEGNRFVFELENRAGTGLAHPVS